VKVSYLAQITYERSAFEHLQWARSQKKILEANVQTHILDDSKETSRTSDIIQGKKRGLIMLFYGPPGTDKSSVISEL
jgi:replication-associated recombination protein RarA